MLIFFTIILFFSSKLFATETYNFPISDIYVEEVEIKYEKHCPIDYKEYGYFYIKTQNNHKKYKNIINLLKKEYNMTYIEGLKYIANTYKNKKNTNKKTKKELFYEINNEANKFFEKNLYTSHGKDGLKYLKNRGITDKNIKEYRIGWAIDNNYALLNHLRFLGYNDNIIEETGLVLNYRNEDFDTFRNRITFPIFDNNGRIIGHSARWLITKKPKYVNTPKTKLHDVGKIFFNQYKSDEEIKKTNTIIIFEGNFDSLIAYFYGIKNTISIMGIKMTDYQIKKIFSSADNIYLCLDSDTPGINAMMENAEKMLPYITKNKKINFIQLPANTDADELILKNGVEEFYKIKNNSISLNEYIWKFKLKEEIKEKKHKLTKKEKFKFSIKLHRLATKIRDPKTKFEFIKYYRKNLSKI